MAARMWFSFLRVPSQIFKNCNPSFTRLGPVCGPVKSESCTTLARRLYCHDCTTQSLKCPHLPSRVWQLPLQSMSTIPDQETSRSADIEEKPDDLDKLYKTVELRAKGHDDAVLDSFEMFVSLAAKELGVTVQSISKPLRKIQRLTLLKSRHIYKKHRVQYEMRSYFRIIELSHLTGSTADVFLEYIERNLPEGVALKVTKTALEVMPDHLLSPPEQENELTSSSSASSSESYSSSSSEEEEDSNP